jgi:hypothetical protein
MLRVRKCLPRRGDLTVRHSRSQLTVRLPIDYLRTSTGLRYATTIEATGQVIGTFAKLIRRREYGEPERCPRCESYRVRENVESDDDQMGFWESEMCGSCRWQSERVFTSFRDHLEGADLAAYLAGQGIGASDRLHRSSGVSDDPS